MTEKYATFEDAAKYLDEYRDDMIDFAQRLLRVRAVSGHEKGVDVTRLSKASNSL